MKRMATLALAIGGSAVVAQDPIYVDASAAPGGDGLSWATAYTDLQDAIDHANGDPGITEVWIAAGTYVPNEERVTGNPRSATFLIGGSLTIRGGFAGTEQSPNERVIGSETILSGDVNGDDDRNFVNRSDNIHQILFVTGSTATLTLDTLTIRGGNATDAVDPIATEGAAVQIDGFTHLALERCKFVGNESGTGGAVQTNSACSMDGCSFIENRVVGAGFVVGGAIHFGAVSDALHATNCLFAGNIAEHGGAVSTFYAGFVGTNCTFVGNHATVGTGAILAQGPLAFLTLSNSILWNNSDPNGSDDTSQLWVPGSLADMRYNCVEGLTGSFGGIANFEANPMFVDPLGPDGLSHTGDEDYSLGAGSPCIDAGDNALVPAGSVFDVAGLPRFIDDPATADTGAGTSPIVDIGAHEYQTSCDADWDGNGILNTSDFLAYLNDYNAVGSGGTPIYGDPDLAAPFGIINTADLLVYLSLFASGC